MNIDDLKKLLAAATPGPWHVGHNELGDPQGPMSIWPDTSMVGAVIARCGPQGMSQGWFEQPAKDAALIVAAVNALPELLAMAEENARLREALQAIADRHIPDQPPAYDVSEADYARKHYMELRMLARAALKETGQ
jgi:NADPH-dependent ferric siderophore reductase